MTKKLALSLATGALLLLPACRGDSRVATTPPPPAGTADVSIVFPTSVSATDASAITVRGFVSARSGVRSAPATPFLRVNGQQIDAISDAGHWSVRVPLNEGVNEVLAEVSLSPDDPVLSSTKVQVRQVQPGAAWPTIGAGPHIGTHDHMVTDPVRNRALMSSNGVILALDLTTGDRSTVYHAPTQAFALDAERRQLYLGIGSQISRVDLDSGDSVVVASITDTNFNTITHGLAIDPLRNKVYGHVQGTIDLGRFRPPAWRTFAADMETKIVTQIPGFGTYGAAKVWRWQYSPALDRVLVNENRSIIKLQGRDPDTGTWSAVMDARGFGPRVEGRIMAYALDRDGMRVVTVGTFDARTHKRQQILEVDLATHERRLVVSHIAVQQDGPDPQNIRSIARTNDHYAVCFDQGIDAFLAIDLATGERVIFSKF